MAAMFDSHEEAENHIEELTSNLHETGGAALPGFETTTYSKLAGAGMVEVVEVQVYQAGTPTDDEVIASVTEEVPGFTEVLGAVLDETTKRIITIDLADGVEPEQ